VPGDRHPYRDSQEEAEEIRNKLLDIVEPHQEVSVSNHDQKTPAPRKRRKTTKIEKLDAQIEELEERAKAAFGVGRDDHMRLFFGKPKP
jgi:hypothetical protein